MKNILLIVSLLFFQCLATVQTELTQKQILE